MMAAIGLAAIPVYFAVIRKTSRNRLIVLLTSQIQVNLFTVLLCIGMDALSKFLYKKQLQNQQPQTQHTQSQQQQTTQTDAQFGYFSPKSKGPAPLTSQKNPFESNKFRYAR